MTEKTPGQYVIVEGQAVTYKGNVLSPASGKLSFPKEVASNLLKAKVIKRA